MNLTVRTPAQLEKGIEGKWEDNEQFVKKLIHVEAQVFEGLFATTFTAVEKDIDCTLCANCCKRFHVKLPDEEIERLAGLKQMPLKEFKDAFTATEGMTGVTFLKLNPCTFLQHNNLCSIYEQRPNPCRNYPMPQAEHFNARLKKAMENYTVCPIIFNTVELLKQQVEDILNQRKHEN